MIPEKGKRYVRKMQPYRPSPHLTVKRMYGFEVPYTLDDMLKKLDQIHNEIFYTLWIDYVRLKVAIDSSDKPKNTLRFSIISGSNRGVDYWFIGEVNQIEDTHCFINAYCGVEGQIYVIFAMIISVWFITMLFMGFSLLLTFGCSLIIFLLEFLLYLAILYHVNRLGTYLQKRLQDSLEFGSSN